MSKLAFNINKYRYYLLGGSAGYANNLLTKGFCYPLVSFIIP